MEVYGRMHNDSTPSLVYRLTSAVAAVTIGSMGVTPPLNSFESPKVALYAGDYCKHIACTVVELRQHNQQNGGKLSNCMAHTHTHTMGGLQSPSLLL